MTSPSGPDRAQMSCQICCRHLECRPQHRYHIPKHGPTLNRARANTKILHPPSAQSLRRGNFANVLFGRVRQQINVNVHIVFGGDEFCPGSHQWIPVAYSRCLLPVGEETEDRPQAACG